MSYEDEDISSLGAFSVNQLTGSPSKNAMDFWHLVIQKTPTTKVDSWLGNTTDQATSKDPENMTLRRPQALQSTVSKAFNALDFDLRLIEPERPRFPINPTKEEQAIF